MRLLLAGALCAVALAAPAPASAGLLPDLSTLPGLDRHTPASGCPFGFVVLPGDVCPTSLLLPPDEAERDAAERPRPPGGPVRTKPAPYSAHSMIYACCTPSAQMEKAFAAARAAGAGYIRLDVNLRGIFTVRKGEPRRSDWAGVDQVAVLARAYRLPVLAVLTHVPDHIAKCNADHTNSCPADDLESYGRYAGLIAKRLEGVATYFEIGNEPDGGWAFRGSPAEYARMLDAAFRHIRASVPSARIVLGGLMYQNTAWVSQMLATPGVSAIRKFSVANVHLRGRAKHMPIFVKRWRRYFADRGFRGQLWVTEHGYPANRLFQYDPAFRGGEAAQAAYLSRSLPALRKAGASQVFVRLRESWPTEFLGEYASEGVISLSQRAPYSVRRKPAFAKVVALSHRWRKAQSLIALRRKHLRAARRASKAGKRAKSRRHRRLARRYAKRLKRLGEY